MGPSAVVEGQIPADPGAGLGDAGASSQVDLLIFDAPPQTLDEDVVAPGALAICYRQLFASKHREAC